LPARTKGEPGSKVGSSDVSGVAGALGTVVICDDHPIIRDQLVAELVQSDRFGKVTAASDVESLVAAVEEATPTVVVVDIELPDDDGFNAIERVAEVNGGARAVILSAHRDPELVAEARRRGAAGFVSKADAGSALLEALEAVIAGGESFPPADGGSDSIERLLSLSPREREILDLISDGRKADEIADQLGIGTATVYTHVRNAMARLSVNTRGEAIALAVRYSYLRPRY
jgi:DNA-binding NarL/FixJ family response regulator